MRTFGLKYKYVPTKCSDQKCLKRKKEFVGNDMESDSKKANLDQISPTPTSSQQISPTPTSSHQISPTSTSSHQISPTPTFSHQISPTEYDLVKVAFFDRKNGIILGKKLYRKNGIILNTVDGGLTWKTVNEDVDQMNDMVLFPNGEVLAVGLRGNIAYSNSSGRTWKNIRYSDSYNFQSVARKGDKSIAFGGDNGVLMYTEGTDIYSQQLSVKSIPQILHDTSIKGLHFFSDMSGICIQYESMPPQATIKITDDGGKIWENTTMPINDIKALFSFSFIDSQTGYACGGSHFNFFDPNPFNAGALIKTIDGGRNWSTVDYGDFVELGGVFFLSKNDGWIVGRNGFISCFHR